MRCADVPGEQPGQPNRIAARHATFGCDPVDTRVAARRGDPCRVAVWIIVMNEAEIELGLGAKRRL